MPLGRIGRLVQRPRLNAPKLPQVVIPTTPTTATCKAGAAVIETATNSRLARHDPQTRARAVIVDPELSRAPEEVSRPAVVNAIAMAVEGLLSPSASPFSDALLVKALHMLWRISTSSSPTMPIARCARCSPRPSWGKEPTRRKWD